MSVGPTATVATPSTPSTSGIDPAVGPDGVEATVDPARLSTDQVEDLVDPVVDGVGDLLDGLVPTPSPTVTVMPTR
jgi:hypothetical protein